MKRKKIPVALAQLKAHRKLTAHLQFQNQIHQKAPYLPSFAWIGVFKLVYQPCSLVDAVVVAAEVNTVNAVGEQLTLPNWAPPFSTLLAQFTTIRR